MNNAAAASWRLREWLLHGPAQVQGGAQDGGVIGSLGTDGQPNYVYSEITGYYLLWLSGLENAAPAKILAERAARSIGWVKREFHMSAIPETRIFLQGQHDDWRNDGIFFFDLAMIQRGLVATFAAGIAKQDDALLDNLAAKLSLHERHGIIAPALPRHAWKVLPQRWSTSAGPFLLKATAAVDFAPPTPSLSEGLRQACADYGRRWNHRSDDMDLGMLHPTLYFAEGLARYGTTKRDEARKILDRCLKLMQPDGSLPEQEATTRDSGGMIYRNDIVAQALRLGLLLRSYGPAGALMDSTLERLALLLTEQVDSVGSISFARKPQPRTVNTWTAMFAEQALRWYVSYTDNLAGMRPDLLV
ncbi:hypothetical protein [Dyella sp. Tek66A03]|uniref:hypothetical protein n=1 Tax=Dyella sp. Tek66A03 TaxID=3458298 RepID=UPI00403E6B55